MPRFAESFQHMVFFLFGTNPKDGALSGPLGSGVFVGVRLISMRSLPITSYAAAAISSELTPEVVEVGSLKPNPQSGTSTRTAGMLPFSTLPIWLGIPMTRHRGCQRSSSRIRHF
jgi:hypothetical protein